VVLGLRHYVNYVPQYWSLAIVLSFSFLAGKLFLATMSKPVESHDDALLSSLRVTVVIPVHNEDPALLQLCLDSLGTQTRLPDKVHLIDDGSTTTAAQVIFRTWMKQMRGRIETELTVQANQGKRHAQANAFRSDPADVFCTVDSDTILDPRAIEEALKPFANPRITGVAGMIMGYNNSKNLLTRILDLELTNSFIIGRSYTSALRSVLVTCGAMACYRGDVIRENLDDYLNQTSLGRPVFSGDDRRLTQYALLKGHVVLQHSSLAYTALPERMSHLVRQRTRWGKSFYRGTAWMLRNMPLNRAAYWITLWRATSFIVFTAMWLGTVVIAPLLSGGIALFYFLYISLLAYLRSMRYMTFHRPGMTLKEQTTTFLLAPVVALLQFFVLTPVRYYSILKLREPSWGTRKTVEVAIA
jgi:hyaluronan synthase